MKYKLICIDMDGTLFTSSMEITDRTKQAIKEAEKLGVKVVIASGRQYNFARSSGDFISGETAIISANGGCVIENNSNRLLYRGIIEAEAAIKTQEVLSKYDVNYAFYLDNTIITDKDSHFSSVYNKRNEAVSEELRINMVDIENSSLWRQVLLENGDSIIKCIVVQSEGKYLEEIKEKLKGVEGLEVSSSFATSLEINGAGVTKGKGVEMVARHYNIKKEEIICIGDGENDISMLKHAGLGVAMGNAPENVKAVADYITDTNDNDGVAKVIEKFVLGL